MLREAEKQVFLCLTRVKRILRDHNPDQPFFLYLSLQAPHSPLQVSDNVLPHCDVQDNRLRRHYAAMLSYLDAGVEQVVQTLQSCGLYENSVLIYSSDDGGQPLSGGSNGPLRGGKGTYWEGGIRAVGFVHSPLLKRKASVSRALIHVSDWYPTLLGLAGYRQPLLGLDGHNQWATISGARPSPLAEILFNIDPVSRKPGESYDKVLVLNGLGIWDTVVRAVIRAGDWKLLTGNVGDGDWIPRKANTKGPEPWRRLEKRRNTPGKSVWLFSITADPYERSDLANSRPEVVKHLLTRLAECNRTAVVARNPPDEPMADPELHGGVWGPWLGLDRHEGRGGADGGGKARATKTRRCCAS